MYCNRDICIANDYNGITCDNCIVTRYHKDVRKAKENISKVKIGDEINVDSCYGVVTMITSDSFCVLWGAGDVGIVRKTDEYRFTGRNLSMVKTLLDTLNSQS